VVGKEKEEERWNRTIEFINLGDEKGGESLEDSLIDG
jgi:hypothetical protein